VAMAHEMASIDRKAIKRGIPEAALLESAGRCVAVEAARRMPRGGRVVVVCGPGNNGGDGLVAARYLANAGFDVAVFLTRPPDQLSRHCLGLTTILQDETIHVCTELSAGNSEPMATQLAGCDLVIDALLGTGSQGEPQDAVALAVKTLHGTRAPILAVDMPTGIGADTGRTAHWHVTAQATIALGAPKPGHLLWPGRIHCGELVVADIGIPQSLIRRGTHMTWVDTTTAAAWFPPRPLDSHKGTFGKVLVVAGSARMPGAAVLTLRGAIGSGAGLVRWSGPVSAHSLIASHVVECTFTPQADLDGALGDEAAAELCLAAATCDAVAIGPGLSLASGVRACVERIFDECAVPVVIDADGLNHLAAAQDGKRGRVPEDFYPAARILTPHPGEMARLLDCTIEAVRSDPLGAARRAAKHFGTIVLLKGVPTIVADAAGQVAFITAGNPALSTGGTGDVLTGMIAGLVAQGVDPWRAAGLAAFWHGCAADRMTEGSGDAGHPAGDLPAHLAAARAEILRQGRGGRSIQ